MSRPRDQTTHVPREPPRVLVEPAQRKSLLNQNENDEGTESEDHDSDNERNVNDRRVGMTALSLTGSAESGAPSNGASLSCCTSTNYEVEHRGNIPARK